MSKKRGRTLTLGVIIGFFIGLFLAPKKGTELRQDAKKKIDTIKENPKDVLHETFEDVKDKVSKLKEDLSEEKMEIKEELLIMKKERINNERNWLASWGSSVWSISINNSYLYS